MASAKNNNKSSGVNMTRQLKWVKPSEVKPYMNNPRHNDDAVEKVAESIAAFGFNSPIVVDEEMTILAGHTRWKAALKLELEKIPVFIVSGLSEKEKRAYRIADNRLAEFSEWDWEKLKLELEDLDIDDYSFLELEFVNYKPILEPKTTVRDVDEEDVEEAEKRLYKLTDDTNYDKEKNEVICPECGTVFYIQQ